MPNRLACSRKTQSEGIIFLLLCLPGLCYDFKSNHIIAGMLLLFFTFGTQKKLFRSMLLPVLFSGYYALIRNPRITSKGRNTQCAVWFTNTLLNWSRNQQSTHMAAVCFDTSAATERHSTDFADYKANRQENSQKIIEDIWYWWFSRCPTSRKNEVFNWRENLI